MRRSEDNNRIQIPPSIYLSPKRTQNRKPCFYIFKHRLIRHLGIKDPIPMVTLRMKQMATITMSYTWFLFLVLVLSSQAYSTSSEITRTEVKFLPGFQGPLPFHLETGYVGVGESETEKVELFYYFVKSEKNPKEDPLILWLTGGRGCSSLSTLAFEIGPFSFEIEEYNGSLPTLVSNPHAWTKICNILFVDLPANAGFSYTTLPVETQNTDFKQIEHAHRFFRKWLINHPEFHSNLVYVGGESYSGLIVPPVSLAILKGNEDNVEPWINFQGYLVGNPVTDESIDGNSYIPFAHGMGLISDELYESLKRSCGGEYQNVDPNNTLCARNIAAYEKCISGLSAAHILERSCSYLSPKPQDFLGGRSLHEISELDYPLPPIGCRLHDGSVLAQHWTNDDRVRKALGIRKGTKEEWKRCDHSPYTRQITSSIPFHVELSRTGFRSLVYSGDHDMLVPFRGTEVWIKSLNYSIVDDWRQWLVQGQVAGYTRVYSNRMTFATVKDGGHTAPGYKPKECFAMFQRWISQNPL